VWGSRAPVRGRGARSAVRWPAASRGVALAVLAGALLGCSHAGAPQRPSILLFVMDTTRADAVSAYGQVRGTTPVLDDLAAHGLRFTRAYANASWTLPSHTTLFTGMLPSQHGVGWQRTRAPDALVTLAERLRDAGYDTAGFSENPWVSETFNLAQGFAHFSNVTQAGPDVVTVVGDWARARSRERPFFLFVNVIDAHLPYAVRDENYFLPANVTADEARAIPQNGTNYFCATEAHDAELATLHGLYLGDVAAADAKLGRVLQVLRDAGAPGDVVTVVTSDHGELFGEHRLVGHLVGIYEPLLHVPLVVYGAPGAGVGVVDAPVQLADVMPTVLGWAGVEVPDHLSGRPLPLAPGAAPDNRAIVAEWYDPAEGHAPETAKLASFGRHTTEVARRACGRDDRVSGTMRALIQYPLKLAWYESYPPQLFDLSLDPNETVDLAPARPAAVDTLRADLERRVSGFPVVEDAAEHAAPVPRDVLDRLHALGYVGDADHAKP